jgi:hypothetical protein
MERERGRGRSRDDGSKQRNATGFGGGLLADQTRKELSQLLAPTSVANEVIVDDGENQTTQPTKPI